MNSLASMGENVGGFLETVKEESDLTDVNRVQISISNDALNISELNDGNSPVNLSHAPKQMMRARLIRTPSENQDPNTQTPEVIKPHTYHDPDVLITELKEPPTAIEGDVDSDSDVELECKHITVESVEAEDEWDTDLEIEDIGETKHEIMKEVRNHDPSGRSFYDKVCSRMGLIPISYIRRHMTSHEITMRFHGLGADAAKAIALVLCDNITLEKLNLQGNWIGDKGGLAMARMLEDNDYITELVLSDNKLGTMGAQCMCKMLSVNAGLRKLDLAGNNFEDKDAVIFAEALENAKYLKELSLARNMFGIEAGEILGPAIGANDILEVLDLSWNHIRGKGATAVAKGIGENVRLKICNISWNGFGMEGGAAIGEAMASNNSLLELDISGNRLTADTAVKISRMISSNDNIKIVRMGNNILTTAGAIALATAIHNSESSELEELDITDVPVEFELLRILEDIKSKKPNFKLKHGPVLSSGNTAEDLGKPAVHPFKQKEPVLILDKHLVINDMLFLDILMKYDPDGTFTVTPEYFIRALEDLAVPFNKQSVEVAIKKMAEDQSGRIYFGDFIKQREEQIKKNESVQRESN